MHHDFQTIHNYHEQAVFEAVRLLSAEHSVLDDPGLRADVACVALNRLPPRYIRHYADFIFYLSDKERVETQAAIDEAVASAIAFVERRVTAVAR